MPIVGITEGGGEGPVAYYIDRSISACRDTVPGLYLRTWYDCKGKPFGPYRKWECFLPAGEGWKDEPVYGFGLLGSAGLKGAGGLNDVRTLKMTAEGCCPPETMKEFIRKERFENTETDACLEAIKLHKRGYFGGGG